MDVTIYSQTVRAKAKLAVQQQTARIQRSELIPRNTIHAILERLGGVILSTYRDDGPKFGRVVQRWREALPTGMPDVPPFAAEIAEIDQMIGETSNPTWQAKLGLLRVYLETCRYKITSRDVMPAELIREAVDSLLAAFVAADLPPVVFSYDTRLTPKQVRELRARPDL